MLRYIEVAALTYTNELGRSYTFAGRADGLRLVDPVVSARSYRHVNSILKNGLDRVALLVCPEEPDHVSARHENVRGASYYQ